MIREINRREWLKAGSLIAGSFLLPKIEGHTKPVLNNYTGEWIYQDGPDVRIKTRLMFNENPYGPSEKAKEALKKSLYRSNLYPFDLQKKLKEKIAKKHDLKIENVLLGSGSTELLIMAGVMTGVEKGSVLSAYPSFESLMQSAIAMNGNWQQVLVDKDHKHDLRKMEEAVNAATKMVYICNPNNPTGTILDIQQLRTFCVNVSKKTPVFVDEAYTDFLDDPNANSVIDLIRQGEQVLVAKTFSKIHGFAGLRVGYLLGPQNLLKKLTLFRPFLTTLSAPSISAALESMDDNNFLEYCKEKNDEARSYTYNSLTKMNFNTVKSYTSFMVFKLNHDPGEFTEKMLQAGIGIRTWSYHDTDWCRVSIGKLDEMKKFISRLSEIS